MVSKETISFLQQLQVNNNKEWFEAHRDVYTEVREQFVQMVHQVLGKLAAREPGFAPLLPKDCIFRINRDVRFSKDKRPYKHNFSAYFNEQGKKSNGAGYYLHIEPGKSFAAAGIWMPESADLKKIRQEIDYNLTDLKKILNNKKFRQLFGNFEQSNLLQRPPKGYEEDNPAIDFLKLKSFVVTHPFTDAEIQQKTFLKKLDDLLQTAEPLVSFLNRAVE